MKLYPVETKLDSADHWEFFMHQSIMCEVAMCDDDMLDDAMRDTDFSKNCRKQDFT